MTRAQRNRLEARRRTEPFDSAYTAGCIYVRASVTPLPWSPPGDQGMLHASRYLCYKKGQEAFRNRFRPGGTRWA